MTTQELNRIRKDPVFVWACTEWVYNQNRAQPDAYIENVSVPKNQVAIKAEVDALIIGLVGQEAAERLSLKPSTLYAILNDLNKEVKQHRSNVNASLADLPPNPRPDAATISTCAEAATNKPSATTFVLFSLLDRALTHAMAAAGSSAYEYMQGWSKVLNHLAWVDPGAFEVCAPQPGQESVP
ncbi:hypothetical protein HDU99_001332 [Rhizoclosmatium hyalinum]|nr:hypothetical protein HDU99_001332 [Rhizoclosmatium hyalinum]